MKRPVCSRAAGRHFVAVGAVVGVLAVTAGTSWAQQRRPPVAETPVAATEAPAEAVPPVDGQEA